MEAKTLGVMVAPKVPASRAARDVANGILPFDPVLQRNAFNHATAGEAQKTGLERLQMLHNVWAQAVRPVLVDRAASNRRRTRSVESGVPCGSAEGDRAEGSSPRWPLKCRRAAVRRRAIGKAGGRADCPDGRDSRIRRAGEEAGRGSRPESARGPGYLRGGTGSGPRPWFPAGFHPPTAERGTSRRAASGRSLPLTGRGSGSGRSRNWPPRLSTFQC